jgi:oligosaccharide repeat unit polymerase
LIITVGTLNVEREVGLRQWLIYEVGIASFFIGILCATYVYPLFDGMATYVNSNRRMKEATTVFFIFGLVSFSYVYSKTGIPLFQHDVSEVRYEVSENAYIATLGNLIFVATVIAGLLGFRGIRERRNKGGLYVFVFIVGISYALVTGSRNALLKILLILAVACHYYVARIKFRTILLAGIGVVAYIGLIGFYRNYSVYGDVLFSKLEFGEGTTLTLLNAVLYFATKELSTSMESLARLLEVVPKFHDFQYGYLFVSPFVLWLPGEQMKAGAVAKEAIGGDWEGGAAISLAGSFYFDMGFLGVIVGMAFVGFLLKVFHRLAVRNGSLVYVLLYAFFLYNGLVSIRSNFMQGFHVIFYPTAFLSFHLLTVTRRIRNNMNE